MPNNDRLASRNRGRIRRTNRLLPPTIHKVEAVMADPVWQAMR
ncbi:hypothetical protein [Granulibacter bethesdensis]|nr:hypothetical protein [Granulibacter bethesdensis]